VQIAFRSVYFSGIVSAGPVGSKVVVIDAS